ncbi:MAG TPA: macro domain-containing protein [Mucilaginibacter sp.]|nr:macro domain-containing protein [Mucilaginibacter sp.]
MLDECIKIRERQGGCKVGEAVITTAGNMPAKYVIHTVGPVWTRSQSGAEHLLAHAYENSLKLAVENLVKSIAFPNISTGIYHFPKDKAAEIAIGTVRGFLDGHEQIEKVLFVCFDEENYSIYEKLLH